MDGHKAMKRWLILGAMSATLAHGEPVEVLGVPLGGKLGYSVKACKSSLPATPTVCWVSKRSAGKHGAGSGTVMLPDHKLPEWAVQATASITISSDGTVDRIDLDDLALRDESAIRASVERRFGGPRELHRPPNGSITEWRKDGVFISMLCSKNGEYCKLDFASPAEAARIEAARQEVETARRS